MFLNHRFFVFFEVLHFFGFTEMVENWLANYGYGHLLPHVNLRTAGLFGTLLVTPEAIRFLALPEILMLMGALVPCWLPAEHRAAVRTLGNGFSTRNLQWNCFSSGSDAS